MVMALSDVGYGMWDTDFSETPVLIRHVARERGEIG